MDKNKTALILGASGLVGSYLLQNLLNSSVYSKVYILGRSHLRITHDKLIQLTGDLLSDAFLEETPIVDHVYCAIGTTRSKTSDLQKYKEIDFGIPNRFGQKALSKGAQAISVVSSLGANSKSKMFYPRIKGLMEEAIIDMGYNSYYIIRPSLITGPRKEERFAEKISAVIMDTLSFLIPKKYKAVTAERIAKKMEQMIVSNAPSSIISSEEI